MDWIKVPLWENDLVIQQDSLIVSDTLTFSDSIDFDTIPVLIKPDSIFTEPADSSDILSGDTITPPSISGLMDSDTLVSDKQSAPDTILIIPQKESQPSSKFSEEDPVFADDFIPFQADEVLFWPRFPFPQEIFSHKDIGKKPKQLDFFIYDKNHKNESGKTTILKHKNRSDILIRERNSDSNQAWLLGVFLIVFILLARMKLFFGKFVQPIINSSISYQAAQNLYRNRNSLYYQAGLNLDFVFFLITGVFISQLLNYYELGLPTSFLIFLIVMAVLLAWLVFKFVVCKLIGFVSLNATLFNEYFHSLLIYNKNIGLLLIPISLGLAYIDQDFNKIFVFAGAGVVSIMYILRVIRLIRLFISQRISWFYSILYLCALEILPILLFFKVFFLNN